MIIWMSRRRSSPLATTLLALAILCAACGNGTAPVKTATGGTLTYGDRLAPGSLNPAKTGTGPNLIPLHPAYESLLYMAQDGSIKPDLATSFGYVGTGNQVFDLTLRTGVKFSDGSDLTAQSVADWINYFRTAGGPLVGGVQISGATALSSTKVEITLAKPTPILPLYFSNQYPVGMVVSAAGLKDPKALDGATFGAGPYMLDGSQTVTGDHYTYVPNPHYYDKSKVKFSKYVVKIISDANARLAAAQSGQVDITDGTPQTADAAEKSGLQVIHSPGGNEATWFLDRAGSLNKPLGDVRIRQAMNFAVDRNTVTKALVGKWGKATVESSAPGFDLYDPSLEAKYTYDVAKAKQLLAEAGYPNGFNLTLLSSSTCGAAFPYDLLSQALLDQFGQVGIKVTIKSFPCTSFFNEWYTKKYEMAVQNVGGPDAASEIANFVGPTAVLNPFKSTDPRLTDLINQFQVADQKQKISIARAIEAFLIDQAWFLSVFNFDIMLYANKRVTGVQVSGPAFAADMMDWSPK